MTEEITTVSTEPEPRQVFEYVVRYGEDGTRRCSYDKKPGVPCNRLALNTSPVIDSYCNRHHPDKRPGRKLVSAGHINQASLSKHRQRINHNLSSMSNVTQAEVVALIEAVLQDLSGDTPEGQKRIVADGVEADAKALISILETLRKAVYNWDQTRLDMLQLNSLSQSEGEKLLVAMVESVNDGVDRCGSCGNDLAPQRLRTAALMREAAQTYFPWYT